MLSSFLRFGQIIYLIIKYDIDKNLPLKFSPLIALRLFTPWLWRKGSLTRGRAIYLCLNELGPNFIKLGQVLSTRSDLLPCDIITEIEKLTDNLTPFSTIEAKNIIAAELKQPFDSLFSEFEAIPIGSASVAQVHKATLNTKEREIVAIKILRPNIKSKIEADLNLARAIIKFILFFWPQGKTFKLLDFVNEYHAAILQELDLINEGANATQIKRNLKDCTKVMIPKIYWRYSTKHVLTMEYITGISITDINQLRQYNINLTQLATTNIAVFFEQIFNDCVFHADMHAGNVFVNIDNKQQPKIILLDFGIAGTLTRSDQYYIVENCLAFINRDYHKIASLHLHSGWLPKDTNIPAFIMALKKIREQLADEQRDLSDPLLQLLQTAQKFNMELQPQFFLLQKTFANLEGISYKLDPNINLLAIYTPLLKKWGRSRFHLKYTIQELLSKLPIWLEKLPELPDEIYAAMLHYKNNSPQEKQNQEKKNKKHKSSISNNNIYSIALIGIALGILLALTFKSLAI